MIQCKDCELCEMAGGEQVQLKCNPFTNIKEPECLMKWQLLRLDLMTRAYMSTVAEYRKLAPMQQKLFRHMSREMDEMDESEKWKQESDELEGPGQPGENPDENGSDDDGAPPLDDRL
jgi:hypothetical protein